MSRIRVLDLAKELSIETKVAIIKLQELGIQVKNHFNALSEIEASKLKAYIRSGKSPEKEAAQKAGSKFIIRRKLESHLDEPLLEDDSSPEAIIHPVKELHESIEKQDLQVNIEKKQDLKNQLIETEPVTHGLTNTLQKERLETEAKPENVTLHDPSNCETVINSKSTNHDSAKKAKQSINSTLLSNISSEKSHSNNDLKNGVQSIKTTQNQSQNPLNLVLKNVPKTSETSNKFEKNLEIAQQQNFPSQTANTLYRSQTNTLPMQQNNMTSKISHSQNPAPMIRQSSNPQTTRPSSTTTGAVIIRKAEAIPQPPQRSQYQSSNNQSSNNQSSNNQSSNNQFSNNQNSTYNNAKTNNDSKSPRFSTNRDNQQQQSGSRPPYGSNQYQRPQLNQSGGINNNQTNNFRPQQGGYAANQQSSMRPNSGGFSSSFVGGASSSNTYQRPSQGLSAGGSRPFVMTDTPVTTPAKEVPSRLKDRERDKDRDKRRITEEEELRNKRAKARAGFNGGYEEDFVSDLSGSESEEITVRTMIPNRKRPHIGKKKEVKKAEPANPTKASKKVIRVDEFITVNDLAGELSQKVTAIIKALMKLGMMATVNQHLDFDTASFVAQEFGFEAQNSTVSIHDILAKKNKNTDVEIETRPPIVTIMGHVDHGKTSLLDAIRSANVASKEAGGITQHIGAYQVERNGRKITFLDTPGHEAFTSMRARGAQVTDIVILVVAADDGVMPQTKEAIAHAKAAHVPIIVAINKIDKVGINIDRITRELSEQGVIPEDWGGDAMFVKVSAKTQEGINDLLESILLQSEVLDLKATKEGFAEGVVIEAKLDKSRGPIATVIITRGTLKPQDPIVAGKSQGRVRAMFNDLGEKLAQAQPGTPVEIIGLDDVPSAADQLNVVASEAVAKEAVAYRIEKQRQKDLVSNKGSSMEELLAMMASNEEKAKELVIIIKADTHGSTEAIKSSLQKLDTPKVKTKIILAAVGGITETDVVFAKASNAIIVGFNVRPDRMASQQAEQSGIKVQCFSIIYELIESVKASMAGTLSPIKQDKILGHAEVRETFSVPKIGTIAGTMVSDGKLTRNSHIRIVRSGIVIYTGRVGSLKRFKDDAKEVAQGFECGISIENYNDLKIGDILEAFIIEEIAASLE